MLQCSLCLGMYAPADLMVIDGALYCVECEAIRDECGFITAVEISLGQGYVALTEWARRN